MGQESKCDTCVYAHIIRGYSESEKITLCDRIFEIPFRVRECSDYLDRRLPCVEDLEDIARTLRSKNAGKTAGVVPVIESKEATEESEQDELEDEPQEESAEKPKEVPVAVLRKR